MFSNKAQAQSRCTPLPNFQSHPKMLLNAVSVEHTSQSANCLKLTVECFKSETYSLSSASSYAQRHRWHFNRFSELCSYA